MSTAGDGEGGSVGQEDSVAAGLFRFSAGPTLEDI
jgi:dCTP diphosphatase